MWSTVFSAHHLATASLRGSPCADPAGPAADRGAGVAGGDAHQPGRHRAPRGGDHDVPVLGLIGGPAAFAAFLAGRQIIRGRDLDHGQRRIHQAAIDELALAGLVAVAQGGEGADRRMQRGVAVDQRGGGAERLADRRAGQAHQPAHRLAERVEGGALAIGAVLAEAGDRGQDDVRLQLAQPVVAEPHLRHRPGTEVFEHDIGARHQRGEDLLAARGPQVEAEALLAAVVDREIDALAAHQRLRLARLLAAQLLDLDDLGAEVGEDHAAARAGLVPRQLEDPNAVQRSAHRRRPPNIAVAVELTPAPA